METQRTLDDEQVQRKARKALEILDMHDDDSSATTNAVRTLEGYDQMTPADREAINRVLSELIG